jgi:hypothetical protein
MIGAASAAAISLDSASSTMRAISPLTMRMASAGYGRRLDGSPARGSKSGRHGGRSMAMDTATPGVLEEGYFMAFPDTDLARLRAEALATQP